MKIVISDYVRVISISAKGDEALFSVLSETPKEAVPDILKICFKRIMENLIDSNNQWVVGSLIDKDFPDCDEVYYVATCLPNFDPSLNEVVSFMKKGCVSKTLCGGVVRCVKDFPCKDSTHPYGDYFDELFENGMDYDDDDEDDDDNDEFPDDENFWGKRTIDDARAEELRAELGLCYEHLYKLKAFSDIFMLKVPKKSHDKVYEVNNKFYLLSQSTALNEFFETAPVELIIGKSPIGNLSDILKKCKETNNR